MKKIFYTSVFWIIVVGGFVLYMKRFDNTLGLQVSNFFVDTDDVVIVETGTIETTEIPVIETVVQDPYTVLLEKIDTLQLGVEEIQESLNPDTSLDTPVSSPSTLGTPSLEDIQKRLEELEKDE